MSTYQDLWPEIAPPAEPSIPLGVLKYQAAALAQKTNQVLSGDVRAVQVVGKLAYSMDIVAPLLSYRYRILLISHDVDSVYPITGTFEQESVALPDEESFIAWLRGVLASDRVNKIINSLLASSMSVA